MIGRVYRLQCTETSKFYIGSTIHTLKYRLKKHRSSSKEEDKMNSPLYTHFRYVGWDKAEMVLIIECEIESNTDLLELERNEILKHIGQEKCLNHNRPLRTDEDKKKKDREYARIRREIKGDEERIRVKQWRLDNPEKYAEQRRRECQRQKEIRDAKKTI
jgi:cell division septum initiation protein DivIVA